VAGAPPPPVVRKKEKSVGLEKCGQKNVPTFCKM
jgi:hypothetical protein